MVAKPLFTPASLRELIALGEGQFLELKGTWSYAGDPPRALGIREMVSAGIALAADRSGRGAQYHLSPDLLETRSWLQQRLPEIRRQLADHGVLTNAGYPRVFGVTRYVAVAELRRLVEEGILELRGERRGAHYVPGPGLGAA